MTVYVLLESHDHEGENLLGVYSTILDARTAIDALLGREDYGGHALKMYPITVNAPPLGSFEAQPSYNIRNVKGDHRNAAALKRIFGKDP